MSGAAFPSIPDYLTMKSSGSLRLHPVTQNPRLDMNIPLALSHLIRRSLSLSELLDGTVDLLICAPGNSENGANAGRVVIVSGEIPAHGPIHGDRWDVGP